MLGYLDELLLLPLGVIVAVKILPANILAEHRARARLVMERPTSRLGAAMVIGVWLFVLAVAGALMVRWLGW